MYSYSTSDESDEDELLRAARALIAEKSTSLSSVDISESSGASVSNATSSNLSTTCLPFNCSVSDSEAADVSEASVLTASTTNLTSTALSPIAPLSDSVASEASVLTVSTSNLSDDLDRTRMEMSVIVNDLLRTNEARISVDENETPSRPNQHLGNRNTRNRRRAARILPDPDAIIDLDEFVPTIVNATNNSDNSMPQPIIYVDLCDSPAQIPLASHRSGAAATADPQDQPPKRKRLLDKNQEIQETVATAATSVNRLPQLTCPVCLEEHICRNPTFTKCGHLFCQKCIQQAVRVYHKCPVCNKKLTLNMLTRAYI